MAALPVSGDNQLVLDLHLEFAHMGNDPDQAGVFRHPLQDAHRLLAGVVVQGAEALIDEHDVGVNRRGVLLDLVGHAESQGERRQERFPAGQRVHRPLLPGDSGIDRQVQAMVLPLAGAVQADHPEFELPAGHPAEAEIRRAQDIPWAVARAFYIAGSGRPGPVVLDFTKTAQMQQIDFKPAKIDYVRSYIPSPDPIESQINDAVQLIDSAKKPLVLVGHGVELGNAEKELAAFIEKGDLPAARTLLGLSALPSDHPLNMGMLGMHGNLAPNVKTNECDVLIAVGMRFDDRVTGTLDTYAKQAKIIHLDIDKSEFGKNVKPDVTVLGDCRLTLKLITERMAKASHKEWIESFKPLDKEEYDKVIDSAIHPADGPLKMGEVVTAVSDAAPQDAVLVNDVGLNQMFSSRYFRYRTPRSIVTSGGLGTMGFCMPAAIGATFGAPERTVLAFMGDGGFQMNIQELGTIMQTQAPVKMILMNNTYLGNVRQWQQMMFNSRYSCTHMMNPDYSKIAAAYGIPYRLVTDRKDLKSAVDEMLKTKGAFLLETAVMDEENVMPMIKPGSPVDKMIFSID